MEKESRNIEVPIEKLRLKVSVREELGDIDALAESIKRKGLLNNLIVAETEDGGYEVICGGRRLIASSIAGLKKLPVRVIPSISMPDALVMIYHENELRKKLTLSEKAKLVCLVRVYLGLNKAAERLRLPRSTVETLYRAGLVLTAVNKVRSSNDEKIKISIKLAEKVYEAVRKAGYTGGRFDDVAGKLYIHLSRMPLSKALWVLSEWGREATLEALQKLLVEAESLKTCVANFKIPAIPERVALETIRGKGLEKLLLEAGHSERNDYEVAGEVYLKIAHLKDQFSDICTFICPRCERPIRCYVCGSIVMDVCCFPHSSVRSRKYRYVEASKLA
ncbi:MAG: ParB N-terminal domain-containing protein [Nitrososphaerota archaeon]